MKIGYENSNREGLEGDKSAVGFKIDYPNDRWDIAVIYTRVGENFDPSLGFVPRKGVHYFRYGTTFSPRPEWPWLRQMFNQLFISYTKEIEGSWQSYRVFTAPINWRLESGDRIEFNANPTGENILIPFEIADEVIIPEGGYHFMRYRLEAELASKRKFSGQATWWFGSFYEGKLDEIELQLNWNPTTLLAFEFNGIRNIGNLPFGDFTQTLAGLRIRLNVTANLQLNSYIQYDTDSGRLGVNARLHWIYSPLGDIFVVFNHNTIESIHDRWFRENRQFLVKARYNFRI